MGPWFSDVCVCAHGGVMSDVWAHCLLMSDAWAHGVRMSDYVLMV